MHRGFLLFFFFCRGVAELKQQLLGIGRTGGIEAVVASVTSTLDERLRRLAVIQQVLLDIDADFLVVGLMEEGTIHIINMLGNGLHAYTTLTHLGEYLQYLFIVAHRIKKGW